MHLYFKAFLKYTKVNIKKIWVPFSLTNPVAILRIYDSKKKLEKVEVKNIRIVMINRKLLEIFITEIT